MHSFSLVLPMSLPRIGLYILAVTFGAVLVLPPLRNGHLERVQALTGGSVSIETQPSGLRAFLYYEFGSGATTLEVTTPYIAHDQPEGEYRVTFIAPEGCRPVLPMRRTLEEGRSIEFVKHFPCAESAVVIPRPTPRPEPQPEPEFEGTLPRARPPLPRRTERLVTFSLVTQTPEITAGGEARFEVRLQNQTDRMLRDLPVIVRFDPDRLSPIDLYGGHQSGNQVMWTVTILEPQGTWERSFTMRVGNGTAVSGQTTVVATVSGRAIAGVPLRERSARTQVAIIGSLPKTGAPITAMNLLLLLGFGTTLGAAVTWRE